MAEPLTAPEIARGIADRLDERGIPYAIGGAIALGYYAAPRATVDVDVNVFVPPATGLDHALDALCAASFVPSADRATLDRQALADGQFRGTIGNMRVDVFVPAISYYAELADRRRQVPLLGRPVWILGAEDLVVLKLMFYRRKDLADIEAILRDQGAALDRGFVRTKLAELVGPADERLGAFADIAHDVDTDE